MGVPQELGVAGRIAVVHGHERQPARRLTGAVHVVADLDEAVRSRVCPVADGGQVRLDDHGSSHCVYLALRAVPGTYPGRHDAVGGG